MYLSTREGTTCAVNGLVTELYSRAVAFHAATHDAVVKGTVKLGLPDPLRYECDDLRDIEHLI